MLLSVIVPAYNADKFLPKNLPTLVDNRLRDRVEVLVVNDGSSDRTGDLAEDFERRYPGYFRVIRKENGGHGSAINRGMAEARGTYAKVVDADDWVITENLLRLADDLEKTDADAVLNPYYKVDERTGRKVLCDEYPAAGDALCLKELSKNGFRFVMHAVTYRTALFRDHGIRLTEKCYYDDFQYDMYPVPWLKSIVYKPYPVYMYLVGQKNQSVSAAASLKNMAMYLKVLADSVDFYRSVETEADSAAGEYMKESLCFFTRSVYNIFLRNGSGKEIRNGMLEADRKIRDISPELYREVGERNRYIQMLRGGNGLSYALLSGLLRIRKAVEIS